MTHLNKQRRRIGWVTMAVLVALLAATPLATAADLPSRLVGTWDGNIDIPGQPLGVIIYIEFNDAGDLSATADIPAQGAFGLDLTAAVDGDVLKLAFVAIPASMELTLDSDGWTLTGVFNQAGMSFPYSATRVGDEDDAGPGPDQIEAIRAIATRALDELGAPGLSIAVVKNGKVVLAEGFGLRDVEQSLPVTADTLFPLGSSTKAFTTAAFQMLVDEGKLAWDRPIKDYIPAFRLYDAHATELLTPLDFATHRSGLPRHEMLWVYNPDLSGEALVSALEHLQPAAELRTAFIYNNLGYVLLGHLIEQASGQPWDVFVSQRILQPLGMTSTVIGNETLQQHDDFAHAYVKKDEQFTLVPDRSLKAIAAAGGIVSSANDMAKWMLFQLNQGRVGDQELISPFGFHLMHTPHFVMSGASSRYIQLGSYGLGWMIDSYRGHYRVHHAGNTIAFSADVALLPQDGIGVTVLTNEPGSPVPSLVINHVLDLMLGLEPIDWIGEADDLSAAQEVIQHMQTTTAGRREGTSPSHDLAEYAGVYHHPGYGRLVIELADDQLVATYYDATFDLVHWHFDQFRGTPPDLPLDITFFFDTDGSGEISSVRATMESSVDPVVFTRVAREDLQDADYLQKYVGGYEFMGVTFDVTLNQGILTLHVPGQPPYALQPMREGQFVFRDFDGFAVHFTHDSDGNVLQALLIQPHGNIELTRVD